MVIEAAVSVSQFSESELNSTSKREECWGMYCIKEFVVLYKDNVYSFDHKDFWK